MTPLEARLIARIKATGPITLADYMAEALLHPEHGYYTTRDPLGQAGDFTTAPEISQMFGELTGLALAQSWLDHGAPAPFMLAELGPGRGTLMVDILRATRGVPGFHDAARLHLVEASPALREVQASRLPGATFHTHLADLPEEPLFLIANEFFDALPVRQAIRSGSGWRERVVGVSDEALTFGLTEAAPIAALEGRETEEGAIVEWHPALPALAEEIGRRLTAHGGAALIVDYGHWMGTGDTLQAIARHKKINPLKMPGQADLTAHVDFATLAHAAHPAQSSNLTDQGIFLERLGITARAKALAAHLTGDRLKAHIAAHRRLTHSKEMGTLFKVLGLAAPGAPLPPGLDPRTGTGNADDA